MKEEMKEEIKITWGFLLMVNGAWTKKAHAFDEKGRALCGKYRAMHVLSRQNGDSDPAKGGEPRCATCEKRARKLSQS